MSQTTGLPEGEEPLPALPTGGAQPKRKDRTKTGATRRRDAKPEDEKKPNIFQRIALFVREVISEMKKVHYPTRDEVSTYFVVVLVFVAALMAFTGLADLAFSELSGLVFG